MPGVGAGAGSVATRYVAVGLNGVGVGDPKTVGGRVQAPMLLDLAITDSDLRAAVE